MHRSEIATINIIAGVIIITSSIPPNSKSEIPNVTTMLTITLVIVRPTSFIFLVKQIKKTKHKMALKIVMRINSNTTLRSKYNSLGMRPLHKFSFVRQTKCLFVEAILNQLVQIYLSFF